MPGAKRSGEVQRRLAAIFNADVAGYARLMKAGETATLGLLTAHRDITDRVIGNHRGRIANTAGDSVLAEFPSAVDALKCALGIQERLAAVNGELPEDRRIHFRIGLHVGEIMVKDGDLFGDGVNIAARMQSLAPAGAICLSETAHHFINNAVPIAFEDLGPQQVKNIDGAIRAYLVRPTADLAAPTLPRVHRHMDSHLARRFHELCRNTLAVVTQKHGLMPVEAAALASIDDLPGCDTRRLVERVGLDAKEAKRIVKVLIDADLIRQQSKSNASNPAFEITAKGVRVTRELRPEVVAAQDKLMAVISDAERQTLHDLLLRVINANRAQTGGT